MAQEHVTAESEVLQSTLNGARSHVIGILDGLSDEDLHRPALPSGWTCLGLVNHLAVDVERFWFSQVMAGHAVDTGESADNAWQVAPGVSAAEVIESYRREIERADAVIRAMPLDASPNWWPEELFGSWRLNNMREILLHVITETSTHAGHLDAARELIDGRQWLVLTG